MVASNSEQIAKIETILQQLDHINGEARPDNRRRATRMNVRLPLSAIILSAVSPCPVQIYSRNLSVSGIAFVSRRMFKGNERVAIHVQVKNLPPRLVLARVTFARYLSGGLYEMGAEFLECLKSSAHLTIPAHWMIAGSKAKSPPSKAAPEPVEPAPESAPAQ